MLKPSFSNAFKSDYKLALKRGFKAKDIEEVLSYLINEKKLPTKYKDHELTNSRNFKNVRECHIKPDWLLIYRIKKNELLLELLRTGSHSDLF